MMEVEKKRSKGGLFSLFDWHSKSKKKLFANNTESNEQSIGGRDIEENSVKSRRHLATEVDGFGSKFVCNRSSDFSSSSSVTSDEGCRNKAPGVVAKLMGLDSLPTSNAVEPHSTLLFEPRSVGSSNCERSTPNLLSDYHATDYLMMSNKEGPCWNPAAPRLPKVQNRPFDRFQTEVLPPKSAKPISITHHKLLSPMKSPGFTPSNNAAYIIEAAAKIIEPSPQASRNSRVPSIGSSSVPLRIGQLKEKMEAVHRASKTQTSKESISCKGKLNDRSHRGSAYLREIKGSTELENGSSERTRVKGKSVSLAAQSNSNVQRREGGMSGNDRTPMNQERNRVKPNQKSRSEPDVQKSDNKRTSANRNSNVLRHNNQKQNCMSSKDKSVSKTSVSAQPTRKSYSTNGSVGTKKAVKKAGMNSDIGSRTMSSASTDTHLELISSKQKNSSRRKRSVAGDFHFGEGVADNVLTNKVERSINSDASVGNVSCNRWSSDVKNKGMDIVSFTFTSPIKRSAPARHSTGQEMEEAESKSLSIDFSADKGQSHIEESELSSGSNMIGGDALSIVLEQKLKELVEKVESSNCNLVNTENSESSAYSTTTEVSMSYTVSSSLRENINNKGSQLDNESSLTSQELVEMDACSTVSTNSETKKDMSYWHPSPVPNQHFCVAVGDCSINGDITEGNKFGLITQVREDSNCLSKDDHQRVIRETHVSDSASSLPAGDELRNYMSRITDKNRSCNWELEYVRNIINSAEMMLEDFTIGWARNVISQDLFNQFENQEGGTESYGGECMKVTRKVLFDCVSEYLYTKCGQSFIGSYNAWDKWSTLYREGLSAEELYKEILSWVSMGDLMADELLDKDMSSRHGRWLDFGLEAFEEGIEIEKELLNNLVNELVTDLYF